MVAPHERTVVWKWASETVAGPNRFGDIIKVVRKRHDMTHRFPHRRYMYEYLTGKAKVDPDVLSVIDPHDGRSLIDQLWLSYKAYVEKVTSIRDEKFTAEQYAALLTKRVAS